jgi:hypothetical protein
MGGKRNFICYSYPARPAAFRLPERTWPAARCREILGTKMRPAAAPTIAPAPRTQKTTLDRYLDRTGVARRRLCCPVRGWARDRDRRPDQARDRDERDIRNPPVPGADRGHARAARRAAAKRATEEDPRGVIVRESHAGSFRPEPRPRDRPPRPRATARAGGAWARRGCAGASARGPSPPCPRARR